MCYFYFFDRVKKQEHSIKKCLKKEENGKKEDEHFIYTLMKSSKAAVHGGFPPRTSSPTQQ